MPIEFLPSDITSFEGEYRWLSNFADAHVYACSTMFQTVEHGYVASKSLDPQVHATIKGMESPGKVKRYGKKIAVRDDWDDIKIGVMRDLIHQKFQIPHYRYKLITTGFRNIYEGNLWNDKFWGVCLKTREGKNWLGYLIMEERVSITGQHGAFIY